MAVVIDNASQLAVNLPDEQANAGLQSGSHSAMMIDPQGNPAVIPFDGIANAIAQGFSQPTQQHFSNALKYAKFSTPVEQLKTLAEGAAGSATFGLSTGLESAFGAKNEDIQARREVNPGVHAVGQVAGLAGSSLLGVGEGALLGKAAAGISEAVGGLKGAALAGAAEFGLMQAGDEVSKMLTNDPDSTAGNVAANIGYSALFGSVFGAGNALIKTGVGKGSEELGKFAERLKSNIERASEPVEASVEQQTQQATAKILDQYGKPFRQQMQENVAKEVEEKLSSGEKLADALHKAGVEKGLSGLASGAIGAGIGKLSHLPFAGTAGAILGTKFIKPILDSVMPALIKPLVEQASNPSAFRQALQYGVEAARGNALATQAVKEVFNSGSKVLSNSLLPKASSLQQLDKVVSHITNNPQQVADSNPELSHYLPNHTMSLAASLARTATYLNSIKPDTSKPGILDSDRVPSAVESANYNRQLAIVEQPLMILKHLKDGTLQHSDIGTMQAVYPDFYNGLKTKLIEHLGNHLANGNKVPYNQAIGMSLFLGQPLDSSMQPMVMVANQATHEPKQMPAPQGSAPKGTKTDFKSIRLDSSPGQAREAQKLMRK